MCYFCLYRLVFFSRTKRPRSELYQNKAFLAIFLFAPLVKQYILSKTAWILWISRYSIIDNRMDNVWKNHGKEKPLSHHFPTTFPTRLPTIP
jgi:hypothetical protein